MAFGEIKLSEVEIVGLDVGTFGDREAHVGEDRGQFVDHLADRMDASDLGRRLAQRQRDIDRFGVQPLIKCRGFQRFAARRERFGDAILEAVDQRPLRLALLRRHGAERTQER